MKFVAKIKMPYIKKTIERDIDDLMKGMLYKAAQYFIQGMIGKDSVPAWTGQARASLTAAAIEFGLTINYDDAEEPNREGKNVGTGVDQGKAFWVIERGLYIFGFSSTVADLNKAPGVNYWEENEYDATAIPNTPWRTIEEAGLQTEKYIVENIFPIIRKYLNKNLISTTRWTV